MNVFSTNQSLMTVFSTNQSLMTVFSTNQSLMTVFSTNQSFVVGFWCKADLRYFRKWAFNVELRSETLTLLD